MSKREQERMAKKVAKALATVSPLAGQAHDVDEPQSVSDRVENMMRVGPYGAYVLPGDPHGWSEGGGPLATIYMESKGGPGDCVKPLDYYNGGMEVSVAASFLLGDYFIEFHNAAIAHVWRA